MLGLLVAIIPVGFGALRAITTGSDFRYLWVALVSSVAAGVALTATRRFPSRWLASVAVAVVAATIAAAGAAFALGGRSVPAVLFVAAGFAVCSGVGLAWATRPSAG
jgi:hypothetical protein